MAIATAPLAVAYVPVPQFVHAPAEAPEYLPGPHTMHTLAPAAEYLPTVHPRHTALDWASVVVEAVPPPHDVHTDNPTEAAYFPVVQDAHTDSANDGPYFPVGQDWHASVEELPVLGLYVPVGQLIQLLEYLAYEVDEYLPSAH